MKIVTGSFYTIMPAEFVRISIARWAPKADRNLPVLRELAPGKWFRSVSVEEYRRRYMAQLAALGAEAILGHIEDLADGRPAALLCWERPNDGRFCHRGFVSLWLGDELGLQVPELGREDAGCGHQHPKLPRSSG